jgi:hypothetical protein
MSGAPGFDYYGDTSTPTSRVALAPNRVLTVAYVEISGGK